MNKNEILIEKYQEDMPSENFIKFIQNIFIDINKDKWLWEYKKSPDGNGYIFLCKVNKKLAIHYSFIINKFILNKKTITIAKSEGSYADATILNSLPMEQRRLFKEVVKKALIILKKDGVDIAYGFPNKHGHKSYIYGGYDIKQIPIYLSYAIIDIKPLLMKNIKKEKILKIMFINIISKLWKLLFFIYTKIFLSKSRNIVLLDEQGDNKLKEFFKSYENNLSDNIISIKRNWKYYKWRYYDNPYNNSFVAVLLKNKKIVGLIVLTKNIENNVYKLDIKDLIVLNKNDVKYLLSWAIKFSIKEKVATLNIWSDKFSIKKYNKMSFYKNGFIKHGIKAKKTIILSILNKKLKDKKLYFELKKYLERI